MHEFERIKKYYPLFNSLYNTSRKSLGFEPHVKIVIIQNDDNMLNPLGKTAHYSPSEHKIALYTQGRHIKDILRSLSHELVHHQQNCRGDFDSGIATTENYAQEDGHLREMEREAYETGNLIFRDWEDNLKKKGGRPLFTSTHYALPDSLDVVTGGPMSEGEKTMKNKINESKLRGMIRSVIQEMFDEDLTEDNSYIDPPAAKLMQARGVEAAGAKPETTEPVDLSLEEEKEQGDDDEEDESLSMRRGKESTKKQSFKARRDDSSGKWGKRGKEERGKEERKSKKGKKKSWPYNEGALKKNERETFLPKDHDILSKARTNLNEELMKRWKYIIKNKEGK